MESTLFSGFSSKYPDVKPESVQLPETDNFEQIVALKHARFDEVRRFMDYYLPTTDKLMTQYRQLGSAGAGEQVKKAMGSIENSLDMIAKAFEKQLERLYADEALDITTDVQVLETMMASDGLTDEGIRRTMDGAKTEPAATARQTRDNK
jgi:hypothetical protein